MKINLIFPGQGAQHENMGKDFLETYRPYKDVIEEASVILNEDLMGVMNSGEKLKDTQNAQKAIFTMGFAQARLLESDGIKCEFYLGASLGEYGALAAAGVFTLEESLEIVAERSFLMQREAHLHKGFMVAVKNIGQEVLKRNIEGEEGLYISNYNAPGQIVMGGKEEKKKVLYGILDRISPGSYRELAISGAFHTPLMKKAGDDFHDFLKSHRNPSPRKNVLSNLMGNFYREEDDLNGILAKHIYSPVRLSDCLSRLEANEGDIHILLGPGKTLLPVLRGNNLKGKIFTMESVESYQKLLDYVRRE